MARKTLAQLPQQDDNVSSNRRTIASYELIAQGYAEETSPSPVRPSGVGQAGLRRLVEALPEGGAVLEVGSGPG